MQNLTTQLEEAAQLAEKHLPDMEWKADFRHKVLIGIKDNTNIYVCAGYATLDTIYTNIQAKEKGLDACMAAHLGIILDILGSQRKWHI